MKNIINGILIIFFVLAGTYTILGVLLQQNQDNSTVSTSNYNTTRTTEHQKLLEQKNARNLERIADLENQNKALVEESNLRAQRDGKTIDKLSQKNDNLTEKQIQSNGKIEFLSAYNNRLINNLDWTVLELSDTEEQYAIACNHQDQTIIFAEKMGKNHIRDQQVIADLNDKIDKHNAPYNNPALLLIYGIGFLVGLLISFYSRRSRKRRWPSNKTKKLPTNDFLNKAASITL